MTTFFISDLHLEATKPEITERFKAFLSQEAHGASAIYILGDLFDAWIGDDDPDPFVADLAQTMRDSNAHGTALYFMAGNRDFLLGKDFAARAGLTILDDPSVIELDGTRVLLAHGDALCTDDAQYMALRKTVRSAQWQEGILAQSLEHRRELARQARKMSNERNRLLPEDIMDVNQEAVAATMRDHDVDWMIHGHTHRPAIHQFEHVNRTKTRIVLGDWYDQSSRLLFGSGALSLTGARLSGQSRVAVS